MAKRQYSDEERAQALAALDANGGNVSKTARDTSIPRVTLIEWRDGRVSDGVSDIRQQKKAELSDRLEQIAHQLVDAMPEKIKTASLHEVSGALKITVEKMQLLRNEPTSINQDASLTDEQRAERVAALLERARTRRAGPAAESPVH